MLDLSFPASRLGAAMLPLQGPVPGLGLPFALTAAPERPPIVSGEARPVTLTRAATLEGAMAAAIVHADRTTPANPKRRPILKVLALVIVPPIGIV